MRFLQPLRAPECDQHLLLSQLSLALSLARCSLADHERVVSATDLDLVHHAVTALYLRDAVAMQPTLCLLQM